MDIKNISGDRTMCWCGMKSYCYIVIELNFLGHFYRKSSIEECFLNEILPNSYSESALLQTSVIRRTCEMFLCFGVLKLVFSDEETQIIFLIICQIWSERPTISNAISMFAIHARWPFLLHNSYEFFCQGRSVDWWTEKECKKTSSLNARRLLFSLLIQF